MRSSALAAIFLALATQSLSLGQATPADDGALTAVPLDESLIPSTPQTPRAAEPTSQPAAAEPSPAPEPMPYLTGDWFGLRRRLADHGLSIEPKLTLDVSRNLQGGLDTERTPLRHLIDVPITIDTDRLVKLPGGQLFLNFQQQAGPDANDKLIGAVQGPSTIDADGRTQLSEIWYSQEIGKDFARIKLGKIDAFGDFGYTQNGGEFLNSQLAWHPTDPVTPTYPDPAFGLDASISPTSWFHLAAGVFDGALQEGINTGGRGPSSFFNSPADLYLTAEASATWKLGPSHLVGRLALGVWHHTGTFDRLDGGDSKDGATGYNVVFDQVLWREHPEKEADAQGLGLFVVYDYGPGSVVEVDHHISAGLAWTGPIPSRDDDVLGVGVSYVHFSNDAGFDGDGETVVEAFYKFQWTAYLSTKLDFQYFNNPGGAGLDDAFLITVRLELAF